MSRAKKAAPAARPDPLEVQRFEVRLGRRLEAIRAAVDDETLENEVYYARFTLRHGVRDGYCAIAGETWDLRIRRAAADVSYRLLCEAQGERPAGAFNAHGLDTAFFRPRLQQLLQVMNQHSPADLARTLARLARAADPRVLTEDEFQ